MCKFLFLCKQFAKKSLQNLCNLFPYVNGFQKDKNYQNLTTLCLKIYSALKEEIDQLVEKLGKTFKIEDQGNLSVQLGIKIERKSDGTLEWTQPTLTQSILKDLKLDGEEIKGRQNKTERDLHLYNNITRLLK